MTVLCLVSVFMVLLGCSKQKAAQTADAIESVITYAGVTTRIEAAKDSLIAFDLYADWCGPCRILSPTIEEIAKENKNKVTFYRVNIDNVPQAAQLFGIRGIPYVVFMKNKNVVAAFTGIQQKEEYVKIIAANGIVPNRL